MPETIRTSGILAYPQPRGFLAAGLLGAAWPASARAEEQPFLALQDFALNTYQSIDRTDVAILAPVLGLVLFAVVTAILFLRIRSRSARLEATSREEIAGLHDKLDRANALLLTERQVMVDWPAASDRPNIDGDLEILGVPERHRVLAFGSWLDAGKAAEMERAVEALRVRGEAFAMTLTMLRWFTFTSRLPTAQVSGSTR